MNVFSEIFCTLNRHARQIRKVKKRMSDQQAQIDAATEKLKASDVKFDAFRASVLQTESDLKARVAELEAQIASGGQLDLTALNETVNSIVEDADQAVEEATPPTP